MPIGEDGTWVRADYRKLRGQPSAPYQARARVRVGDLVRLYGRPEFLRLLSVRAGIARVQGNGETVHEEPLAMIVPLTKAEKREALG